MDTTLKLTAVFSGFQATPSRGIVGVLTLTPALEYVFHSGRTEDCTIKCGVSLTPQEMLRWDWQALAAQKLQFAHKALADALNNTMVLAAKGFCLRYRRTGANTWRPRGRPISDLRVAQPEPKPLITLAR